MNVLFSASTSSRLDMKEKLSLSLVECEWGEAINDISKQRWTIGRVFQRIDQDKRSQTSQDEMEGIAKRV